MFPIEIIALISSFMPNNNCKVLNKEIWLEVVKEENTIEWINRYKKIIKGNSLGPIKYSSNWKEETVRVKQNDYFKYFNIDIYTNYLFLPSRDIGEIPKEISNMPNLNLLILNNNRIKWIPIEVGNLVELVRLDIAKNEIQVIPSEICNLKKLTHLNLSNNFIKEIPIQIGNLKKLYKLYLSNNKINVIPLEMETLDKVEEIYLVDNIVKLIPDKLSHLKIII